MLGFFVLVIYLLSTKTLQEWFALLSNSSSISFCPCLIYETPPTLITQTRFLNYECGNEKELHYAQEYDCIMCALLFPNFRL